MRKIKEVLRLKWANKLSNRQIAIQCSISRPTVSEYIRRAEQAQLGWPLPDSLNDRKRLRKIGHPQIRVNKNEELARAPLNNGIRSLAYRLICN